MSPSHIRNKEEHKGVARNKKRLTKESLRFLILDIDIDIDIDIN